MSALLCFVVAISDGDTLKVRCDAQLKLPEQTITVRVAEIDAPEKAQPFGKRSRQYLADLCFQQQAEVRPATIDRYGRTVARVVCAGTDASAAQARAGMAWAFTKYLTDPSIKALEEEARAAERGLWIDADPLAPWEFRKKHRQENHHQPRSRLHAEVQE